ncbi:reverse transcriptase domain-containing protein [Tanacetum coccineum]|uniref:Reverse transcriptase domain-containing protein n=1 Tax=Tanacetum coccineum TaxID=301880 RepID=A0ABQ5FQM8_9ASTR
MPANIKLYDGTTDPEDHLSRFSSAANSGEWPMPVWCRMFQQTLDGSARGWFKNLSQGSIDTWVELRQQFTTRFSTRRACFKDPTEITKIMRNANKTLMAFKERWIVETCFIIGVPGGHEDIIVLGRKNVVAPGMYKVNNTKKQETNTNKAKIVLSSIGLKAAPSVRRPLNRDSSFKNCVLSNTKKSSEKVEVFDKTNKKLEVAFADVVLHKKIVTDVVVKNTLKARNVLCVSCAKNVVQIILWIVDSDCSKHMIGDRSVRS